MPTRFGSNVVSLGSTPFLTEPGLLQETQTFRDRVLDEGGTIEDGALEGLYDPVLSEAKNAGWYSDIIVFLSAAAVKSQSASIANIFDASGNELDASQTTTSKQPTLQTAADFNGRRVAKGDQTDDILKIDPPSISQPYGSLSVFDYPDEDATSLIGGASVVSIDSSLSTFSGQPLSDGPLNTGPITARVLANGQNSEIYRNGSLNISGISGSGSLNSIALFNNRKESRPSGGRVAMTIQVKTQSAFNQLENIIPIVEQYYSL